MLLREVCCENLLLQEVEARLTKGMDLLIAKAAQHKQTVKELVESAKKALSQSGGVTVFLELPVSSDVLDGRLEELRCELAFDVLV